MSRMTSLGERAAENLAFVREVVERAERFTAVPGWGGVAMGITAIGAAWIAHRQPTADQWVLTWLIEAAVGIAIGGITMVYKARRVRAPLDGHASRRFLLGLMPALLVGAVFTVALWQRHLTELLVPVWLCSYGLAVLSAGAVSAVRLVPVLGGVLVLFGAVATVTPAAWGDAWMALGFGVAQGFAGAVIARRYGG